LWFENCENNEVNQFLDKKLRLIPTYKVVPLTHQIFARLGENSTSFQMALHKLVLRMASDHPFHTLWQLFALANNDMINSHAYRFNVSAARCKVAKEFLTKLENQSNGRHEQLISSMEKFVNAYIQLATASTEKFQKVNKLKNIPFKELVDRSGTPFHDCILGMKGKTSSS
jgi:ataxia telangiectasia mutated family protein